MLPRVINILSYVGAAGILFAGIMVIANFYSGEQISVENDEESITQAASIQTIGTLLPTTPIQTVETEYQGSEPEQKVQKVVQVESVPPLPEEKAVETEEQSSTITRIQVPYDFPQFSIESINTAARAALVNILCFTSAGNVRPITASGVVIDARGIILTNAHAAQYVLLSQSPKVNLTCTIRQGAPARALWKAEVLYIPSVWVREHAKNLTKTLSTGTGEHDYALLRITSALDGSPPPTSFAALPHDSRERIGFLDDAVLAASYPAEFVSNSVQFALYPVTTMTTIRELLTFQGESVDLFSVGGIAGAQGGSSGGSVMNAWGRLIGIITTSSEGKTTGERDLRAVTLSYISRDLKTQTGSSLTELLGGDAAIKAALFNSTEAPLLIELLLEQIPN